MLTEGTQRGLQPFIHRPDIEESTDRLSARLFAGELLVYSGLQAIQQMVSHARTILEEVFGTQTPQEREAELEAEEFQRLVTLARRLVSNDRTIDECWEAILHGPGLSADEVYRDRVRLRVVPSHGHLRNRIARPLAAHRDTWASGIMSQTNWWLPLYPLSASATMHIWPEYFNRPVANNSADWDYHALLNDSSRSYPLLPVMRETPTRAGLPVLIEPGELLVFSAAHLHASGSNDSGLTRFSLDTRSVRIDDVINRRAAENIDGPADRAHWEMFIRPEREHPRMQGGSYR